MKDFLKSMLANVVALAIVGGIAFVVFIFLLGASMASGSGTVKIPKSSVLTVNMGTKITDKPSAEELSDILAGNFDQGITLHQFISAIEAAADDKRIKGLYLTGVPNGISWATVKEMRDALIKFKETGKPIYAYNSGYNEASYFLASVADKIMINPSGAMELNGLASQVMFFKGTLDKYGVDAQVTRVGKYKSAVEPFLQESMSEANREQIQTLLDDIFDVFVVTVAEARSKTTEEVRNVADTLALLLPDKARDLGLVDEILYFDEVLEQLKGITGDEKKFKSQVSLDAYVTNLPAESGSSSRKRVAVIYAEGTIVDGGDKKEVGGDHVARLLRKARQDSNVKAVVLRVNSPGGSAAASEVILREARLIKEEKPFVVSMGGVAASGGYWISTYADEIFAEPNTVTGSIGVFGLFFNFEKLMNEHGLKIDTARTSGMADVMSMYRPKTEQELAIIQTVVDGVYEDFLDRVSEGRGLDREKVHEIAQGRVWSGTTAKELGLVDEIGGLTDAVAAAAKRAELGDDYRWYHYQRPKTFTENMMEALNPNSNNIRVAGPLDKVKNQFEKAVNHLEVMNSPTGVYTMMPYQLNID